jgi:hypothetical protein
MTCYEGGCHCGAIAVRFTTEQPASALVPRADQCGFCRRHNAAVISDPAGRLEIDIAERAGTPYRFGLEITDFHVCKQCGVFVAASGTGESASLGVVNIHALRDRDLFSSRAAAISFDGESVAERQARRRLHWTPARTTLVANRSGAT